MPTLLFMTTMPVTTLERVETITAAGGPGGDSGAPTVGDIITMLRRRMVLIVALFILFAGMSVGGWFAWRLYTPGFRSECLIELISDIPATDLTQERTRLRQEEYERFVLTQALFLKSANVLGEALKVNAVRSTQWYRHMEQAGNQHLLELTDTLIAGPVRGTNFLRVAMEWRVKEDIPTIINEVVRQWYDSVKRSSAEQFASKPLDDARDEEDKLKKQVDAKRAELKRIALRLPAGARVDPTNNITNQQVTQYGQQVAQLSLELAQLDQYRTMYNDPMGVAVTAEDRAFVEQDPQVAELARTLFQLQQQMAADSRVYGSEHKAVKQLATQLSAADEKLAAIRTEKLRQRRNDIREATNTSYANTQQALFLAQENLARAEAELQDQDQQLFAYKNLEAEVQQDSLYLQQLSDHIRNLSRVIRQQTAVKINIAQSAIAALEPSSPSKLLLPVAVFMAMVMSLAIGLGLEWMDKSMRTPQDIGRYLSTALLGVVPDTDDEETRIEKVESAFVDAPRSMVADAFRRLRASLQFTAPMDRQRSVLVTSAGSEDGKTTVASNLALAVAQGGRKVLLIDANLHRPGLQKVFKNVPASGLSNILIGDAHLTDCVVKTGHGGLDVLGAGRVPPNPTELLVGGAWAALLKQATSAYDQVIIDAAPVLLASDALVLASTVDGVILVVRARANSRGVAKRAVGLLSNVGARVFGAVLNAAQITRGGYFRQQFRDYYDYQGAGEGQ